MSAALIEAARAALEAWDSLPRKTYSLSMSVSEWLEYRMAPAIARLRTALAAAEQPAEPAPHAMQQLTAALKADPDYAWSWHCNLAMPVMDATGVTHRAANEAGARLMQHLFDIDITKHPHYRVDTASPAAPAQAPLTDEQLSALILATVYDGDERIPYRDYWTRDIGEPFARAIERAHGIGSKA